MGRNVTIKMTNLTGHDWTDLKTDVEDGKFNEDPPESVANNNSGSFTAGNKTGITNGPKGKISYSMGNGVRIYFTWDHPFSASTSTYHCYSDPNGKITFTMTPAHPEGHNQSISFTVQSL